MIPGHLVTALCEAAGVKVTRCQSIDLQPHIATFVVLSERDGKPYLDDDGDVAKSVVVAKIDWSQT